ncbi:hypothetical protein D3C77_626900 [compost metagenome]
MGQLVRHHAADLLARQHVQQTAGRGDGGVLRIAAGGEGVRLVVGDDGDVGQGQAGVRRHLLHVGDIGAHHRVGVGLVHRLGAVHLQDDLVRVPIGEQVHRRRRGQGDHHAGRAADQIADPHEQGGHHGQEGEGLEMVHAAQSASGVARSA